MLALFPSIVHIYSYWSSLSETSIPTQALFTDASHLIEVLGYLNVALRLEQDPSVTYQAFRN